jgi:outer membrane protein assembly factor BamE (lipoprotein component of BamABCDE complex)
MERLWPMVNVSRNGAGRARRLGLPALAILALSGCSTSSMPDWMPALPPLPAMPTGIFDTPRHFRGNLVSEDSLAQVTVGVSSRDDVATLLGSPSATGTFDENEWFYIGGITRQRPARTLAVIEQRVVKISFNQNGTVQEVRQVGPEEGRDIQVVQRTTPSPGSERSIMQQLFGNIGRVGPNLGATQQTGPGVTAGSGPR